jgi:predicted transcriptional regulator
MLFSLDFLSCRLCYGVTPSHHSTLAMAATSTTSIKLSDVTRQRLERLAEHSRRSPHWMMREAIEEYLDREEAAEKFRADALAAWEKFQQTGQHVTASEVNDWLGRLAAGEHAEPPKCHR